MGGLLWALSAPNATIRREFTRIVTVEWTPAEDFHLSALTALYL